MMFKRVFLAITAAAVITATGPARADDSYPSKPVKLVLGFAVGGPTDVIARVLAKDLTVALGQPFVVENRPGANSMIATELVSRAPADGYTLLMSTLAHNVNAIIAKDRIKYDPFKDFAPVNLMVTVPMIAVTRYDAPFKSLGDVVEAARKDPEKVTYGSAGNGGSAHLAAAYLATASNTKMTHVPFKGNGPALTDVMAGQVDFMFYPTIGVADLEAQKRLRALAITTKERHPDFPNLPTTDEAGFKGFDEYSPGVGMLAPAGTPPAIVEKLNKAIQDALRNPATAEQLRKLGAVHAGLGPKEFAGWLRDDFARWERVIKAANIHTE
jgi:tripartite-type tricarboxylate transporter receptor subunit TctC